MTNLQLAPTPAQSQDPGALLARIERLEQSLAEKDEALAFERADNERLRARETFLDQLFAVDAKIMGPGCKVTQKALTRELGYITPNGEGWKLIKPHKVAKATNEKVTEGTIQTVRDHITYMADHLGLYEKRPVRFFDGWGFNPKTGKPEKKYRYDYWLRETPRNAKPVTYRVLVPIEGTKTVDGKKVKVLKDERDHGGDRSTCGHCGSHEVDVYKMVYCRTCGKWSHTTLDEAPFDYTASESQIAPVKITDEDGTRPLTMEPEDDPQDGKLTVSPHPTPTERQDASVWKEGEPITRRRAPLDSTAILTACLEQRIGERIICATGKLVQDQKYFTQPEGYTPDIAAYLRGDPEHIYGSRLRLSTGMSWLIEYDFDDGQPEHDQHHKVYMRRLADAGIASYYSVRRDKRGHLAIPFTAPVDPQAAYTWANSIVPELATVNECYPVNGVEDKRNEPLSWPFYQRIGSQVTECKVEVMYPAAPGHLYSSKGITSEPEKLAELLCRCVTDASRIPPIAREDTPAEGDGRRLLDTPSPRTAWEDDLIEAFNRSHSWGFIADLCGGWSRTGHFKAIWRCERTASVKPDGTDSRYACDYGNHGDFPKKLDKYGAYCLIMNVDQVADLKKRRADLREALAS